MEFFMGENIFIIIVKTELTDLWMPLKVYLIVLCYIATSKIFYSLIFINDYKN